MPCGSLHTWFLIQLSPSGMYQKNVKDYTEVFAANVNLCYMTLPKKKKSKCIYINKDNNLKEFHLPGTFGDGPQSHGLLDLS